MSEQEEIKLYDRIRKSISNAQLNMIRKKVKLGEPVIIADCNGMPIKVSAEDALDIFTMKGNQ